MPMSRASLSLVPNRSIAVCFEPRVLGEDVDHPVTDVEHRRAPRAAQRGQRLGDGQGEDGDDDAGVAGDGRRRDEPGEHTTEAVHAWWFVTTEATDGW